MGKSIIREGKGVYGPMKANHTSIRSGPRFMPWSEYKKYTRVKIEKMEKCPRCKEGYMTTRKGIHGKFYGCSEYPRCKFTKKI